MDLIEMAVFLGNYGKQYEKNRHNAAWLFADSLAAVSSASWSAKFKGEAASITAFGRKIQLLKPHTFMNLSGESIVQAASFYKIKPEEILVVHDELELPFGTVSLKWSGGLGGHNGLRSVKSVFGTQDFWRLRFGLTKPAGKDIADYVLSPFSEDEQISLSQIFPIVAALFCKAIFSKDMTVFLPEWSKKKLLSE